MSEERATTEVVEVQTVVLGENLSEAQSHDVAAIISQCVEYEVAICMLASVLCPLPGALTS
jgi:hypothetical protein